MIVKLLTEHHLKFLSLKGGCTGPSESTHVKMPHYWRSHATAQMLTTVDLMIVMKIKTEIQEKTFDISQYGPCLNCFGWVKNAITLYAQQPILGPTELWGCSQI